MTRHPSSAIYSAHRTALVAYVTPMLGSREAAEDVVQDAFIKFAPTGGGGEERGLGYLYRIVRNLALDVLKRRRVEARTREAAPPFWALPREEATPEQQTIVGEEMKCVARALAELPPEQRMALEMHRLGGHTLEEVSNHLGISVATAHRHVRSALAHLARRLDRSGT